VTAFLFQSALADRFYAIEGLSFEGYHAILPR
jgi:hypothetical protein